MSEPGADPAPDSRGPSRRRLTRRLLLALALLIGIIGVLVVLSGISALLVRSGLTDGRTAMNRGRTQLLDGNATEAVRAFDDAEASFGDAASSANAPWVQALGFVPYLGRTPDTMRAIAQAGLSTAQAGRELAGAVAQLPDGLASLAPSRGRIPVGRIEQLAEPLARADALATGAYERVVASPSTLLAGPLGRARAQAEDQLGDIRTSLHAAAQIVRGLPTMLGADGTARLLFAAENPAELRGTGGILGAYSILTVKDGRFRFSPFRPVQSLPLPKSPADVPAPSEQYRENYDVFRDGNGYWLNANMTPDFPLAGDALLLSYEALVGSTLDGVVTADPFALKALLAVTGPEKVPGLGVEVDADNVVAFTTNEAYAKFPDAKTRKLVLGAVAERVLDRFLAQSDPKISSLRAIGETAGQGHVNVYSADPQMQAGLAETGVGGAMPTGGGDFLSVIQNSASGNKLDYYLNRQVDYAVTLNADGSADARLVIFLKNLAPSRGLPRYVIGPFPGVSKAGENVSLLNTYCSRGCEVASTTVGRDRDPDVRFGAELGRRYSQVLVRIPGTDATVIQQMHITDAWEGNSSGGTYRLTFLDQTMVSPRTTRLSVSIRAPDGMQMRSLGGGLQPGGLDVKSPADQGYASYAGDPDRTLELEATFSPPLATRWIRNITRPLSKPVIRF